MKIMINNLIKHLKLVHTHRKYVRRMCYKMGIFWRGLVHDLSKYSLKELSICKYYDGTRSPHAVCREKLGYSPSWLYHRNRNKHHFQFWIDDQDGSNFKPIKIPYKYVIEMFCDMVGANKAYTGDKFTEDGPWNYYQIKCKGQRLMHDQSRQLLEILLQNYMKLGEKEFIKWFRKSSCKKLYEEGCIDYQKFLLN